MAQHVEINPDNESLPFSLGLKAVRLASTQKTHKTGTIRIPTSTGKDFIAGKGAEDGANWIDEEGNQTSLVDTSEIDKSVEEVKKQAEDLSQKSDDMAGQITDIKGTVNGQQTQLTEFGQKLEGEITRGDTTVKSVTELKQTVTGISATVEQTTQTADAALDKASKAEQNADGIRTEVSEKYQTKDGMTDYATKSFVDQTAQSVALGVVQDYKGADGSGLATKSDISVSKTEITSEVSSKYATKDGVSEEISSKITQNNSSWELKFASKTEAKSAQDAANAANAAAADAQARVGNLEPCIRMTSDGVRVGKRSGDSFTGTSALVGTDATFDVLDSSGKRLLEVSANGVKFPHSKDGTRLALGYVAGSDSASDTLYIGDIITGQQEGGPRNRLGFTGDEVSLEGGDIGISANDNQLSLYGHKGANLLVPDGGNVQVGGQYGTSNTTLTLRGSTVNMSGGLVNVNGRTLNAPVDAKQSQRWDNIQLDVKCVNRVVTVNILHPLGTNAVIGDPSDQCEIGYIREGYRPSRMIGCHLAAYNTTNLFLEINPSTGKVACFRLWGNQNTWAYFSASLSYVI